MIGVVVTGHINFASGIASALKVIAGDLPQMAFVDFTEDLAPDALEAKLLATAQSVDTGDGVLFLTDLFGGTPNNCCVRLIMQHPQYELISGTNLSMAIGAALERDELTMAELLEALPSPAMTQIKNMRPELKACSIEEGATDCSDDGI